MTGRKEEQSIMIRIPAEYEEQDDVWLTWPNTEFADQEGCYNRENVVLDIIYHLINRVNITITCDNGQIQKKAEKVIGSKGIDLKQIKFYLYPSYITFPRDYGAEIGIDEENGKRVRVDFRFNFYGLKSEENELSFALREFSAFQGKCLDIKDVNVCQLISEGGNREFNGEGILMSVLSTEQNRNPDKSIMEIERILKEKLGISRIIWIPRGTYDDDHMYGGSIPNQNNEFNAFRIASANGHIDEMCRFVSKDTVLLAEISEEEGEKSLLAKLNKERLDEAYQSLSKEEDIKIIRIPYPEPIYISLMKGDDTFEGFKYEKECYNGYLLDGTKFPESDGVFLPAMSYCNFLISNGVVLVPQYFKEGMPSTLLEKDRKAVEIIKKCFPDRIVIGIDTLPLNLYGGGIHCATRNIPKNPF